MGANWGKAGASRIIKAQNLGYAGTATQVTTNFTSQTYQVRVISQVAGYIAIDNTGTSLTSGAVGGTMIAANTASGDYFQCSPGQVLQFTSTSTTSGNVSVTELF
jgi:hypothetical protein